MNKKLPLLLSLVFLFSIATVWGLFLLSGQLKDQRGSFLREFPPHPVREGDSVNIKVNSYYLAGGTKHKIYLANYTAPLHLLEINLPKLDTHHVRLHIDGIANKKFWSTRIQIDSPYFYFFDGSVPAIYRGETGVWQGTRYLFDSTFFRDFITISNQSLALKSLSGRTGENILGKITPSNSLKIFKDNILEKQQDGIFCTDGTMRYNKEWNQLIYLYYYRNQFMIMDSSLNLIYRGNTIDTTRIAKIKTASMPGDNTKTLSSPPYFVNRSFDTSGSWIFVNSNLHAKNESINTFKKASVIDVYHVENGKYAFSFYIYHFFGNKRLSEFRVFGDLLVARHEDVVRIYHLKSEFFQPDMKTLEVPGLKKY